MNTFYQIPRILIKPFILNNEGERFFVFKRVRKRAGATPIFVVCEMRDLLETAEFFRLAVHGRKL